ncbi:GNAT family N-acetyltransferase, partial [Streptomyces sp. SID6137]|nr:GNAT family N-acetyltransferase [Streptomyces sp. SID6137]
MTTPALELRHYGHADLPEIRQTLIDVQRDVYADVIEGDE